MRLDLQRVRNNVQQSTTEDLLDRATVYRQGMEPEALDIIDDELRRRGVSRDEIAAHEHKQRENALLDAEGIARKCFWCRRPAVGTGWDWHRLWGWVPIFPRRFAWCSEHRPASD